MAPDLGDRDLGRLARYCAGKTDTPPEVGVLRHALATAQNSTSRSESSPLLGRLRAIAKSWPHGDWVFQKDGLVAIMETLTTKYPNPHTGTLRREDYSACRVLVAGDAGALWLLVQATTPRRSARRHGENSTAFVSRHGRRGR